MTWRDRVHKRMKKIPLNIQDGAAKFLDWLRRDQRNKQRRSFWCLVILSESEEWIAMRAFSHSLLCPLVGWKWLLKLYDFVRPVHGIVSNLVQIYLWSASSNIPGVKASILRWAIQASGRRTQHRTDTTACIQTIVCVWGGVGVFLFC